MSSLAQVRAQIKAWERDFASRHGRDPALQDIRDHPPIAEKYKLYKRLSKAATHLPVQSRAAEPVPPLPGFNPFSPVKKFAKRNDTLRPSASQASPRANPFATPTKNRPNPHPRMPTPSPDRLPSIMPPHPDTLASTSRVLPVSSNAVSRARKRLRGEPVSPSPNKPKRQRVRSQVPISKLDRDSSNSEPGQELPHGDFTFFVEDSPVKPPAGSKSFKLLFDDALPSLSIPKKPVNSYVAQPDSPDANLSHCVPTSTKLRDLKSKGVASGSEQRNSRAQDKILAQIFPAKDHLPVPSLHKPTFGTVISEDSQPGSSMKRALDVDDLQLQQTGFSVPLKSRYPLIPPSPPPKDSISRDTSKGKAKTIISRKKLRIEDNGSDEADSPDDVTLKVATISQDRAMRSPRHADDVDWDPLPHLGTRDHDLEAKTDANHHAPGTFSVNLPDKFRRVLAISPSRSQNSNEERVVRGLLYGDRVGHYDPSRGGDIWDAGETDEGALGDAEVEDDWEGEPVPWEVGEL